jgi:protocatechuate 3,4-dioxygenase, beta subunit
MNKIMFSIGLILFGCEAAPSQLSQKKLVGGGCEGCELIFEGIPSTLSWQTTIAENNEPGESLIIDGTIYHIDGRTPAANVILYVYHTNNDGLYSPYPNQTIAKRHGRLRGWMRTNAQGRYQFRTIRPQAYPNATIPAHIHPVIKEEEINEYYIDEFQFDDDPLLTTELRLKEEKRGGSGIIRLTKNANGEWIGRRDIILGLNIPNY